MEREKWKELYQSLNTRLRLQRHAVAVKYYEDPDFPKRFGRIKVSQPNLSPCMLLNQAAQFGWTVACLRETLHADYCRGIHGMFERDEKWFAAEAFAQSWFNDVEQAKKHHAALSCLPAKYAGFAAAPIADGVIEEPDVCILYLTPGQAFMLLAALQMEDYRKLSFTFVGESTCSDSFVTTILTGEPKLSLPCFADVKFGGMKEEHVLVSMTEKDLAAAVENLSKLHKKGLRYPVVSYSVTTDMWGPGGLSGSYTRG